MADQFPALDDDFGSFGSSAPAGGSFLERELALLGEDAAAFGNAGTGDIDFEKAASAFPDLDGVGGGAGSQFPDLNLGSNPPASSATNDLFGSPPRNNALLNGGSNGIGGPAFVDNKDDIAAFESEYPSIEAPIQNGFSSAMPVTPSIFNQATPFAGGDNIGPIEVEEESEAIREWRVRQSKEIAARDEASAAKKEEVIAKAEKAIDDFYREYNVKKERNIAQNKKEEEEFLAARTDALAQGTTWQRIADLIELSDSRSKTNTRSTKDLGRMKEIILSLKREGESAPGASGFANGSGY
ncbi:hypothetical protein BT69DRAFT_1346182 [Atractiella rhizophila]|nr:hypothetical protein BT69DRAFT_1346182 [Atractiella rhizophila]